LKVIESVCASDAVVRRSGYPDDVLNQGRRLIAHDRRGHGRSTQAEDDHEMGHAARFLFAASDVTRRTVDTKASV
jgi:pimeloyl-ACP methyl ester carboxylesterase